VVLDETSAGGRENLQQRLTCSIQQIETAQDVDSLYAWAISQKEGAQWALQRLSKVNRQRYCDALEQLMKKEDGKWVRQIFQELANTDPERAAAIAKQLPADKIDALTISAFALVRKLNMVSDEKAWLAAIIKKMHDPKNGWDERGRAIELLVPADEPLRYPGNEIDDALLRLLEHDQADETINFTLAGACRALALRGRVEQFDRIAQVLAGLRDPDIFQRVLGALVQLAQLDPSRFNPHLLEILKPHLAKTNVRVPEILWAIWAADLRELKPDLERLATSASDDFEDKKASSYGGSVTPVEGRFHLARKCVSIWNESDAPARIRLLVGLTLAESYDFVGEPSPERVFRMRAELAKTCAQLSELQKKQIDKFLQNIEHISAKSDRNLETTRKVIAFVRSALGSAGENSF